MLKLYFSTFFFFFALKPSDKDAFSHSVTSLATDPLASSEQNGRISNGDGKT